MAQEGSTAIRAYPILVEVDYKFPHKARTGHGWTESISSRQIRFITAETLLPKHRIDLSIAWPALLHGKVALRLCIQGRIIESRDNCVSVEIQRYEFRTTPSKSPALSEPLRRETNAATSCPMKEAAEGLSYDGASLAQVGD